MTAMMEAPQDYVAILLAAGQGTRFGADKLLHPLADGIAIAAHAARHLKQAGLDVLAVTRAGDARLRKLLEDEGCRLTVCAEAALGMGHSLAHGVEEARDANGWIVALADMPSVMPATIVRIVDALRAGAMIAAPVYQGKRGHPVAFAHSCGAALARLTGDAGARALLESKRDAVVLLECDDPGVLYDVDRKADL